MASNCRKTPAQTVLLSLHHAIEHHLLHHSRNVTKLEDVPPHNIHFKSYLLYSTWQPCLNFAVYGVTCSLVHRIQCALGYGKEY